MEKKRPGEPSLWQNFIDGDDEAFSSLYIYYIDVLYAYGRRYLADGNQLTDCIQEMFIDLYKYRGKLAANANVKFYLFSSLKHKIYKTSKKILADQACLSSYELRHSDVFNLDFNAEEVIIRNEAYTEYLKPLLREMNLLPPKQKEILYLRFNSNLEYEEIADLLDISLPSCRTMVYRAIKKLRVSLEKTASKKLLLLLSIII